MIGLPGDRARARGSWGYRTLCHLENRLFFWGEFRFIEFIKSNFLFGEKICWLQFIIKPHSPNKVSYLLKHVLRTLGFYMAEAISCRGHGVGPSSLESHLGSLYDQKRGTQANDGGRQASKPFV